MKNKNIHNVVISALFLAIGIVLPFLTGQIPQIGSMLLPLHIPVMLCGLVCGWRYGLAIGGTLPILRSLMFGMPPLYPSALAMAFECAAYGATVGFLFEKAKWKCLRSLYRSLIVAMILGRVVWGSVMFALVGIGGGMFTFSAFITGAFLNAIPGIILQLVLIPSVMLLFHKTHLVKLTSGGQSKKYSHKEKYKN